MPQRTYRVIQWMTGDVGQAGLRHFLENPVYELAAVVVHSPEKVGKDAGELVGAAPVGVAATDDIEAAIATEADCVFYTPVIMDVDTVCRLLESGKNVVTTSGFYYPTAHFGEPGERIRAACAAGGVSFHSGGIHPGYAGDLLPLTVARVSSRIDKIELFEVVNVLSDAPLDHIDWMGFGKDKDTFVSEPTLLGLGVPFFAQSMHMLAEGLGVTIDRVTAADVRAATATTDIPHPEGVLARGTVAAQHHEWTGWVQDRPLIVYHAIYLVGRGEQLDPPWDWGTTRYRLIVHGDPNTELTLQGLVQPDGSMVHPGYTWTAMGAVNTIPAVCDAPPGWLTHLDLGLVQPRGLVR